MDRIEEVVLPDRRSVCVLASSPAALTDRRPEPSEEIDALAAWVRHMMLPDRPCWVHVSPGRFETGSQPPVPAPDWWLELERAAGPNVERRVVSERASGDCAGQYRPIAR
jgi:hypothetical protein